MRRVEPVTEYEGEPIPGLPDLPPEGEEILWQGSPHWPTLARRAFHVRTIAVYFAILLGWRGATTLSDGSSVGAALGSTSTLASLALLCLGILTLLAWLNARATIYTITNRRVVIRFGVAVPLVVNVPFAAVRAAELKVDPDGTGDIPLAIQGSERLGYLLLWPYARAWGFGASTQPMLRAVPEARAVGGLLSRAIRASTRRSPPIAVPADGVEETAPRAAAALS